MYLHVMNIAKYNNQLIKMYEETINKQYNAQNDVTTTK